MTQMKDKRIYHPYYKWEEYKAGMWSTIEDKKLEYEKTQEAIAFTGDHELYGRYMIKVTDIWKYSCEHNLTNLSINRKAWIGHAAACIAIACPEYITRAAWWELTEQQRILANKQADKAIKKWELDQKLKRTSIRGRKDAIQMEFQMNYHLK